MVKKMFALASVTALAGLVSTAAMAGCSSTNDPIANEDAGPGGDGGKQGPKQPLDAGDEPEDAAGPAEEGTVGKACDTAADCEVADSKNDNVCSKGGFATGDLFGTPICIQPTCKQGAGQTVGDLLCDGNAGLCLPTTAGSKSGICLALCEFDSTTVTGKCEGGNKCSIAYGAADKDGKSLGLGYCEASCQADADCKGTAGQKCQVETGICLNADKLVTFAKAYGAGCNGAATAPECNCNAVGGTGADKDKGVCTRQCITGAAGDAACGTAVAGWTCTAKLPKTDSMGKAQFTAQPDDIRGQCALPCLDDATCTALQTATGAPMKCKEFSNGKFCETSDGT